MDTQRTSNRQDEKEVVIITGSSGLIGRMLVKRLQDTYQVIGLDKMGDPYPPKNVEAITMDITDEKSINKALERTEQVAGRKIASVIHLIAYVDFSEKENPMYEEITIKGTEKFVNALKNYDVEQFVFSSTNLVYKPTEPGKKIKEDCPKEAHWQYPESKINTEEIVLENRDGMKAVLLRLAGAYDSEGHSPPITNQIKRIYEKEFTSHLYSGDTNHGNVFVHLDDVVEAIVKTIEKRKSLPEEIAINIGEPETPTYQQIQDTIGMEIHGKKWKTFEMPEPLAKAGAFGMDLVKDAFIKPWMIDRADDHYELDIERARTMLGWEPSHRLLDSIPEMIRKLKEDPLAWYKENDLDPPSDVKKGKREKDRQE
jgi:nucleoside-diphosphate-sugar epimerase